MRRILTLCLLWPTLALAKQTSFERVETAKRWSFDVGWRDDAGRYEVHYAVDRDLIDGDRAELTFLPRRQLNQHAVAAIEAYGATQRNVTVTASIERGGVRIGVSGPPDAARAALAEAEAVRDRSIDAWLADNRFFRMASGSLSFDHARLVGDYAPGLTPVAAALTEGVGKRRQAISQVLSFVQSIPYEKRTRKGDDPGYRRPLALLFRNRGDCDSKAVLFLGLLRADNPKLPMAMVYIPGHALVGLGITPRPGDTTLEHDGQTYVLAEPVGPAEHALGVIDDASRKGLKRAEVYAVP